MIKRRPTPETPLTKVSPVLKKTALIVMLLGIEPCAVGLGPG